MYEVHMFCLIKQNPDESVLNFVRRLRTAAKYCEFHSVEFEIASSVLSNGSSEWLTKKALASDTEPTLTSIMKLACSNELSTNQSKAMRDPENINNINNNNNANNNGSNNVNSLDKFAGSKSSWQPRRVNRNNTSSSSPNNRRPADCGNCGDNSDHKRCPAKDSICQACGPKGHWAVVCRSKHNPLSDRKTFPNQKSSVRRNRVSYVDDDNELFDEDHVFTIRQAQSNKIRLPTTKLKINGQVITFIIDTGSTMNIIDIDTFNKLTHTTLTKPICNAYRFDSNKPINFAGRFVTEIKSCRSSTQAEIHVLKYSTGSPCILSYQTAKSLGLIHIVQNVDNELQDDLKESFKRTYPKLFSGKIGCLKDFMLELHEDTSIKPTKRFHYRIPYHLRPQVEQLLDAREKGGLIEKATGPTSWISACHVVPKKDPSQIRLVIDARPVNKAIKRHRHITPTLDDIAARMSGSTTFSKVDFKEGYRQILLHPDSRHLTTFSTHKGLFRDTRLGPGLCAGAESFQYIVGDVLKDIQGVMNVSDDIIIYGADQESHDESLKNLLNKLESVGFTANLQKCQFNMKEIEFFGVTFSAAGMSPSATRVDAFQKATAPDTISETRSMLASANYSSRFIKDFSTIIALRELTHNDALPFKWLLVHESSLKKLKAAFTKDSLAYFNPAWDTEVFCDASPVGLGAFLVQSDPNDPSDKRVIAFASRSLSKLERKYSQVEREALALIFAVERFHQYVYGKRFKLYSDAKAIVFIYGGNSTKSPARIERWGLRLLPYDFELIHTPGDGNPADYLSRHPVDDAPTDGDDADLYVNFIIDYSIPRAISRQQIALATKTDKDLQTLIHAVKTSNRKLISKSDKLATYNRIFDKLAVSTDGIVLRGHQIVIPSTLRHKMVEIAHEGHLKIVKTRQVMRRRYGFPSSIS